MRCTCSFSSPAATLHPCLPPTPTRTRIDARAQQLREHGRALALGGHRAQAVERGGVAAGGAQRALQRAGRHHPHGHAPPPHVVHQVAGLVGVGMLRGRAQSNVVQGGSVKGVPAARRRRILGGGQQAQHFCILAPHQRHLHGLARRERGRALLFLKDVPGCLLLLLLLPLACRRRLGSGGGGGCGGSAVGSRYMLLASR